MADHDGVEDDEIRNAFRDFREAMLLGFATLGREIADLRSVLRSEIAELKSTVADLERRLT